MSIVTKGKFFLEKYPTLIKSSALIFNKTIGRNKIKIRGKNNRISGLDRSFLNKTQVEVTGNSNLITIKDMSYLNNCSIYIYGNNNNVEIGENVFAVKGDLHIEDDNNSIIIGEKTAICGYTHVAVTEGKKVIIGKDCMFSSDVIIRTGDSHSIVDNDSGVRINHAKDVIIGDHVWLGNKTTVLKGSIILSNSIVGTGSIVSKEINKENVIVAGIPAKIVSENINWQKERI